MRNSFRFWMQDSTGETTPPDTRPLFGPRLQAFLGSLLGPRNKSFDPFPTSSPDRPLQVSDFPRQVLDEQFRMLHVEVKELRAKERAVRARADLLNAAIQYTIWLDEGGAWRGEAVPWLKDWNEGDESADDELRAWLEAKNGKTVCSPAVVGRDGMCDVPAPVGRERPKPAPVQPAPGSVAPFTYKGEPPPVSLHPAPIKPGL